MKGRVIPVKDLADDDLLAVADSKMTRRDNRRLGELLAGQRDGELTPAERTELEAMIQVYQEGSLRKAQALAEAVRRGLRERPAPWTINTRGAGE